MIAFTSAAHTVIRTLCWLMITSTTTKMRNRRPSVSVPETKSSDGRWWSLRQCHWRSCPQGALAATTTSHLQPFLGIQPPQLLVFHADPSPFQQQLQAPPAKIRGARRRVPSAAAASSRHDATVEARATTLPAAKATDAAREEEHIWAWVSPFP
jgi:hypothetical protein